jgi:hypothetical protein
LDEGIANTLVYTALRLSLAVDDLIGRTANMSLTDIGFARRVDWITTEPTVQPEVARHQLPR